MEMFWRRNGGDWEEYPIEEMDQWERQQYETNPKWRAEYVIPAKS